MQNDRNLDMALQRALKSYLIGSALLSCVFYLAIPPSGYGVSLFWQFLSSIHQTTFLPRWDARIDLGPGAKGRDGKDKMTCHRNSTFHRRSLLGA
jgi:hypothetical protein